MSGQQALSTLFLGSITEVCIVTPDYKKTIDGLMRLGIGPFQIFDFNNSTVKSSTFRNNPGDWTLTVAFAKHGPPVFEIMQPTGGTSLMSEYLQTTGGKEGVQHMAFDMNGGVLEERKQKMQARGFEIAQEGIWLGKRGQCHFCFFDTLEATGTIFETIEFSEDWEDPDHAWYPYPPSD